MKDGENNDVMPEEIAGVTEPTVSGENAGSIEPEVVDADEDELQDFTEEDLEKLALDAEPEDKSYITISEVKDDKISPEFIGICIAIVLAFITLCITLSFKDSIGLQSKQFDRMNKQIESIKESEESKEDVYVITSKIAAVRHLLENGKDAYTLFFDGGTGMPIPKHIYDELKDSVGSVITFYEYTTMEGDTVTKYYSYEFEPEG